MGIRIRTPMIENHRDSFIRKSISTVLQTLIFLTIFSRTLWVLVWEDSYNCLSQIIIPYSFDSYYKC